MGATGRRSGQGLLHVGVVEGTEHSNGSQKLRHQILVATAHTAGERGGAGALQEERGGANNY